MIEISWEALLFIILGANSVWLHWKLCVMRHERDAVDNTHSNAIGRMIAYLRYKFPEQLDGADGDEFGNYVVFGGGDNDGDNTERSDTTQD